MPARGGPAGALTEEERQQREAMTTGIQRSRLPQGRVRYSGLLPAQPRIPGEGGAARVAPPMRPRKKGDPVHDPTLFYNRSLVRKREYLPGNYKYVGTEPSREEVRMSMTKSGKCARDLNVRKDVKERKPLKPGQFYLWTGPHEFLERATQWYQPLEVPHIAKREKVETELGKATADEIRNELYKLPSVEKLYEHWKIVPPVRPVPGYLVNLQKQMEMQEEEDRLAAEQAERDEEYAGQLEEMLLVPDGVQQAGTEDLSLMRGPSPGRPPVQLQGVGEFADQQQGQVGGSSYQQQLPELQQPLVNLGQRRHQAPNLQKNVEFPDDSLPYFFKPYGALEPEHEGKVFYRVPVNPPGQEQQDQGQQQYQGPEVYQQDQFSSQQYVQGQGQAFYQQNQLPLQQQQFQNPAFSQQQNQFPDQQQQFQGSAFNQQHNQLPDQLQEVPEPAARRQAPKGVAQQVPAAPRQGEPNKRQSVQGKAASKGKAAKPALPVSRKGKEKVEEPNEFGEDLAHLGQYFGEGDQGGVRRSDRKKKKPVRYVEEEEEQEVPLARRPRTDRNRRASDGNFDTTLMMVLVPTDAEQLAYGAKLADAEENENDEEYGSESQDEDEDGDSEKEEEEEDYDYNEDEVATPGIRVKMPPAAFAVRVQTTTRTSMQRLPSQNGQPMFRIVVVEERIATIVRLPGPGAGKAQQQAVRQLEQGFSTGDTLRGTLGAPNEEIVLGSSVPLLSASSSTQMPETHVFVASVSKNGVPVLQTSGMISVHLPPGYSRSLYFGPGRLPGRDISTSGVTVKNRHWQPVVPFGQGDDVLVFRGQKIRPELLSHYLDAQPDSKERLGAAKTLEMVVHNSSSKGSRQLHTTSNYRGGGNYVSRPPQQINTLSPIQSRILGRLEFFKQKSKNLGKIWARRKQQQTSPDRPLALPSARPAHLTPAQAQLVIAEERWTRLLRARENNEILDATSWKKVLPSAFDRRRLQPAANNTLLLSNIGGSWENDSLFPGAEVVEENAQVASMADSFKDAQTWSRVINERVLAFAQHMHRNRPWKDACIDEMVWAARVRRQRSVRARPYHWAPSTTGSKKGLPPSELELRMRERQEGALVFGHVSFRRPLDPVEEERHDRTQMARRRKLKLLVQARELILAEHLLHLRDLAEMEDPDRELEATALAGALSGKLAQSLRDHEEEMRKMKALAGQLERATLASSEYALSASRARADVEEMMEQWKEMKNNLQEVQGIAAREEATDDETDTRHAPDDKEEGVQISLVEMSDHRISLHITIGQSPAKAVRVEMAEVSGPHDPFHLVSVKLRFGQEGDDSEQFEEDENELEEVDELEEAMQEIKRLEANEEAGVRFMRHLRVLVDRRRQAYKLGHARTLVDLETALRREMAQKWQQAVVECQLYDRYLRRISAELREENQNKMTDWLIANERRQEATVNAINYIIQQYQWTVEEATDWVVARFQQKSIQDNLTEMDYVFTDPIHETLPEFSVFNTFDALFDERPSYLVLTAAGDQESVAGSDRTDVDNRELNVEEPKLGDEEVEVLVLEEVYGESLEPPTALAPLDAYELPAADASELQASIPASDGDDQPPSSADPSPSEAEQMAVAAQPPPSLSIHSSYFERSAQFVHGLCGPDGAIVGSTIVVDRNLGLTAMHTLMNSKGEVLAKRHGLVVAGVKVKEKASFPDLDLTFLDLPNGDHLGLSCPATRSVCPVLPDNMRKLLGEQVFLVSHPRLQWPQFHGSPSNETESSCTVVRGVISKILNKNSVLATYKCLPSCAGGAVFLASSGELLGINTSTLCGGYITEELRTVTTEIESRFGKLTDPAYERKKSELMYEAWVKLSAKYQADYARKNLVFKKSCGLFVPWNVVKEKQDKILETERNKQLF